MSILFLSKLEFTLILLLAITAGSYTNSLLYAQNVNKNHKIERISELIEKLEGYPEYIPKGLLLQSKELAESIRNNTRTAIDTEVLDEITNAHIDFLKTLIREAENKIELEKANNKIKEEQQLHEKLSKYNNEVSEELKNYQGQ